MKKTVIEKYLDTYAEKDIKLIPQINESFDNVIIIPAHNEYNELLDVLNESLVRLSFNKNNLIVLVINGSEDSRNDIHETNIKLIKYLENKTNRSFKSIISYTKFNNYSLVIVNRATQNQLFDKKSGVGLARKLGCDVALNIYNNGNIKSDWLRTTDADVVLPDNYLEINPDKRKYSAITYPFYHDYLLENEMGLALQLYEVYLRYYYLGLLSSGSPYAFQTVGSSMAISTEAYAQVRGFPSKREAAEDFYMLNKLAKILPVYRSIDAKIIIRGRPSDRVPFGTGASMAKIGKRLGDGDEYYIYNPDVFSILKKWYEVIDQFCIERDVDKIVSNSNNSAFIDKLKSLGVEEALNNSLKQTTNSLMLKRHIHTWFDGFRTLKLINLLSSDNIRPIKWYDALKISDFITIKTDFNSKIEELRSEMFQLEMKMTENYNHNVLRV